MGYCVTLASSTFTIPAENMVDAWATIVHSDTHNASSFAPGATDTDKVAEWLEDAGFEVEDDDGTLRVNAFPTRKSADEEERLAILAPHALEGSIAEWIGEDDSRWRGLVRDGVMIEQTAVITWKD